MRCVSIQEFLSAAVMFTPRMSLTRVATAFLTVNLPKEFMPVDSRPVQPEIGAVPLMVFARKPSPKRGGAPASSPTNSGKLTDKKASVAINSLAIQSLQDDKKAKKTMFGNIKKDGPNLDYLGAAVEHVRQNVEQTISKLKKN